MDTFSIVFVCTGNRFRSPLAEAFVRRLTLGLRVDVDSCGVLNLESSSALREAAEIGTSYGVDLSQHRTKWLREVSLGETDLVVAFQQSQMREAVVEANARRDRSFTFREIVRLLESEELPYSDDVVHRARALVQEAARRRRDLPALRDVSIADPFGSTWRAYRETATEIHSLAVSLTSMLFGVSDRGLPSPPVTRRKIWGRVRF
jgi:protein-tyrosine phosphatase